MSDHDHVASFSPAGPLLYEVLDAAGDVGDVCRVNDGGSCWVLWVRGESVVGYDDRREACGVFCEERGEVRVVGFIATIQPGSVR